MKYAGIILLIIGGCVVLARTLSKSETVADYALSHPAVEVEIEQIPQATDVVTEEVPQINDGVDSDAPDLADGSVDSSNGLGSSSTSENSSQDERNSQKKADNDEAELVSVEDSFYIEEISDELKDKMRGKSYADGIDESKVNFDMLRHVVICYNDFNNETVAGELVCSELIAQDLLEIFEELYYSGYQLEEVSLIDKYDADDDASMDANNTSCFNYRVVDNTTKLSYHAYGLAIDVNPFYNPYVQFRNGAEYVCPTGSVEYADRSADFPYKIDENDLCYKLFRQHGFTWGGAWNSCKDYQHFEKRLR